MTRARENNMETWVTQKKQNGMRIKISKKGTYLVELSKWLPPPLSHHSLFNVGKLHLTLTPTLTSLHFSCMCDVLHFELGLSSSFCSFACVCLLWRNIPTYSLSLSVCHSLWRRQTISPPSHPLTLNLKDESETLHQSKETKAFCLHPAITYPSAGLYYPPHPAVRHRNFTVYSFACRVRVLQGLSVCLALSQSPILYLSLFSYTQAFTVNFVTSIETTFLLSP